MDKEVKDTKMKKVLRAIPIIIFTILQIIGLYLLYVLTLFTVHFSAEYEESVVFEHIFLTILFLAVPISNIYILFWLKMKLKFKFLIQLSVLGVFAIIYLITINFI